jgi:hypothetical protein
MINNDLERHVKAIADDIHNGVKVQVCQDCGTNQEPDNEDNECSCCGQATVPEVMDGMSYLMDALDLNFVVSSDLKVMQSARILVAFGGPNIWVDTGKRVVEGYWGGDSATASFHADPMGLELAASDLYWSARS